LRAFRQDSCDEWGSAVATRDRTGGNSRQGLGFALALALSAWLAGLAFADGDLPTGFTNMGTVANTRHNLSQRAPAGGVSHAIMNPYRNDYGEVCVYCHTPHGANTTVNAPLWNRTNPNNSYTVYNLIGSQASGNAVTQPGANSITCLSCHDGTVAVDSIINMPGSGRYNAAQQTSQNNGFLNASWNNATDSGGGGPDATQHLTMVQCMACHSPGAGVVGAGATDFTVFVLGTDLRDDHPVGVRYPATGPDVDFKVPTATRGNIRFFDSNSNGRPDKNEIRLYDSGDGFEVECASCHDPHGVGPGPGGSGGPFNRSFLRISNSGSAVCLSCHVK
jgi:mono/diheme cytochrome c family protein